ncbi:MAG: PQQ-binding-like beta-propeller repeat protein [Pirellulales bacterium]|nr:PQQ-binding-like beta-propeller repeat protein [Pirellulales bacterium]
MSLDRTLPVVAWHDRCRRALAATLCVVLAGGCDAALNKSPQAVSLPAVDSDDAEARSDGGQWSGWRGSHSAGIATDKGLPVTFGPQAGVRWKVEVPGAGNSSPVVWGDRIYLTSALGSAPSRLTLLAFDRNSGKIIWQTDAAAAAGATHDKNGHASASVATNGQLIFAFFGASGLFAFDSSGRQVWQRSLGPLEHGWGTASSPVLYEDLVIQLADSQANSSLRAFRQQTGEPVWTTARESTGCWTTPVLIEVPPVGGAAARTELIVNGTGTADGSPGYVIAYDPRSGSELWRVRGTTDIVCPTALVAGGLVYSMSGRNGPMLAIRPGGAGDVTASHVVWKTKRGGPYVPTGVVYRNRMYVITDGGVLACHNAGDGTRIWQQRLRGAFTSSLVAGDGHIYAANERGTMFVVVAADEFKLLAENELDERMLATPAIANGELFVRTEDHLWCIGATPAPQAAAIPTTTSPLAAEIRQVAADSSAEVTAPPGRHHFSGSLRAADAVLVELPKDGSTSRSPRPSSPAE